MAIFQMKISPVIPDLNYIFVILFRVILNVVVNWLLPVQDLFPIISVFK